MTTCISDFRYIQSLLLVRRLYGFGKLFRVAADYEVTFRLDGQPVTYTVPRGLWTDLSSIPRIVPRVIAEKLSRNLEASVVHDAMYEDQSHGWDRETVDRIFLAGMIAAGVARWRARLMYWAVRVGGQRAWET